MQVFIVLCLMVIASGDKLGYNYRPVGHSGSGLSFVPGVIGGIGGGSLGGGSGIGSGFGGGIAGGNDGLILGGLRNALGSGLNNGLSNGLNNRLSSSNIGGANLAGPVSYDVPAQTGYNKEYFTFSAPEQDFEDNQQAQRIASLTQKNLRVVFIKTPENKGLENAVLNLAKQASDQKTAIYVLQKQTDIGDLANKLNAIRNNNNAKPEVHFVKYRTPEDAANAQRQIQAQYDSLGGSSRNHNGGVAPVLNFASQGPITAAPAPQAPGSSYLPSSIFRKRV